MKYLLRTIIIATLGVSLAVGGVAFAENASTPTAAQKDRTATIKARGSEEITRRLAALDKLTALIQSAQKLSSSDKTSLMAEVSTTTSGLGTLKTELENDATLEGTRTNAKSIVSEYRVYALVMPKVHLVKIADDQFAAETALSSAATKLQARLTSLKDQGKDVSSLLTTLADMNAKIADAQKISTSVQASVMKLQPSDYNSDHTILQGYNTQLKAAHAELVTARKDADIILQGIAALQVVSKE